LPDHGKLKAIFDLEKLFDGITLVCEEGEKVLEKTVLILRPDFN